MAEQRNESSAASARAADVSAAVQAAQEAADLVLTRSNLWLVLHPMRLRRLRRDMLRKRDTLLRVRAEWRAAGRPV